jgi:hypothetical protein
MSHSPLTTNTTEPSFSKPSWPTVREFAIKHHALDLLIEFKTPDHTLQAPVITDDFEAQLLNLFIELRVLSTAKSILGGGK